MIGMVAGEGGVVARDFVGDPSASGHERSCTSAANAVNALRRPWHD